MNRMKILIILISLLFVVGCRENKVSEKKGKITSDHHGKTYYTCAMHPQVKEKKPGKCPICHMNLTMIKEDDQKTSLKVKMKKLWRCENYPDITSEKKEVCPIDGLPMIEFHQNDSMKKVISELKIRKSQMNHFRAEVINVRKIKMVKKIRLLGSVMHSEERQSNIPARVGGRVEKVYVKSTGSFVKVGDPVVDYYSPQLIAAGEEYLLAKKSFMKNSNKEFKEMMIQSEERLKLWGVQESQYKGWFKDKKVPRKITLYSSSTGIVAHLFATVGKYFKEGEKLFHLTDLSDVWVEMDVYEHDSSLVKLGQSLNFEFSSMPGRVIKGEIDFIGPVLNPTSRTLKVRATVKNVEGKLKPGMTADATLLTVLEEKSLAVPRSAVIDTGKRKIIWIQKDNNTYQALKVKTGIESDSYISIVSGVKEGDPVVIEGNFLLDAQSQLFGGYEDLE